MIQQLMNELNVLLIEDRKQLGLKGRSFLILKKEENISTSFAKGIKSLIWKLYLGTGERGYLLFAIRCNSIGREDMLLHDLESAFILEVFKLLRSTTINYIIKEEFHELYNESVSNSSN